MSSPDALTQSVQSKKAGKFVCPVTDCQKTFRFKSDIQRHLPVHSNLRPHVCTYFPCTRAFKRVDALQDHIRSQHTHEASLVCPYIGCGKAFTTNAKLRYHTALHDTNKSHQCTVPGCEKSFVTLSQLKQHQKSLTAHRNLIVDDETLSCKKLRSIAQSTCGYSDSEETAATSEYHTTKKVKSDVDSESVDCFFSFDSMEQFPAYQSTQLFTQTSVVFTPTASESDNTSSFYAQDTLRAAVNENDMLKAKLEMSNTATESLKQQLEEALALLNQSAQPSILNLEKAISFSENMLKLDQCDIDMHFNLDFDMGMNLDLFKECLSRANSRL